jgi:hypothetical protein
MGRSEQLYESAPLLMGFPRLRRGLGRLEWPERSR